MKLLKTNLLHKFIKKHASSKSAILAWHDEVTREDWSTPQDIKNRYRSADFLHDNKVIFNIKGNHFRLVVQVKYVNKVVLIEWVGTHAEYNRKKF
jgi:mRNA interferase HigB